MAPAQKRSTSKGKTTSNKATKKASHPAQPVPQAQGQSTPKQWHSVTLEEVQDEEPTHQGAVLDGQGDTVMEEAESAPPNDRRGGAIEISESEGEDKEKLCE